MIDIPRFVFSKKKKKKDFLRSVNAIRYSSLHCSILSFLSPDIAALRLNVSYSLPIDGEWDFTFWVA